MMRYQKLATPWQLLEEIGCKAIRSATCQLPSSRQKCRVTNGRSSRCFWSQEQFVCRLQASHDLIRNGYQS